MKCPSCNTAGHKGGDVNCPNLILEKEVLKVQAETMSSYVEAKEKVKVMNARLQNSHANKVKVAIPVQNERLDELEKRVLNLENSMPKITDSINKMTDAISGLSQNFTHQVTSLTNSFTATVDNLKSTVQVALGKFPGSQKSENLKRPNPSNISASQSKVDRVSRESANIADRIKLRDRSKSGDLDLALMDT